MEANGTVHPPPMVQGALETHHPHKPRGEEQLGAHGSRMVVCPRASTHTSSRSPRAATGTCDRGPGSHRQGSSISHSILNKPAQGWGP